jgi:diacylglycerol kinase family enzyme
MPVVCWFVEGLCGYVGRTWRRVTTEPFNAFRFLCMFPRFILAAILGLREVRYFRSMRARVETETPMPIYADGEYVCQTPAEFAIQPGALKVITP